VTMIIDIKSTKAAPESEPSERYELKSMDKKSNLPILVGGFATCVVLYVQSLFMEGGARPEEPTAPEKPEDAAQDRSVKLQLVSVSDDPNAAGGSLLDATDGGKERPTFASRFGSAPIDLVDETPFRFFHANLRSNWDGFAVSPVIPTPSNDNGGPAPVRSAPEASGGGSAPGAKPPTDSDEHPPDDDDDTDTDVGDNDNRAPRVTGPVYLRDVVSCGTLAIALSELLRNVEDPDGDVLSVTEISASAGVLTQSGAEWIYSGGPIGPITITYKVSDGYYSVLQTAHFSVLPQPPIHGDDADNVLLGTMCDDEIAGRGGDDNIDARAGNDVIDGGAGHDHIVGGVGNDIIYGRSGNDLVFGGLGHDHISGGEGDDRLFGQEGDDIIFGDDGNDFMDGGDGHDILAGGAGDDVVQGGAGQDTVEGGEGDDQLSGGAGHDRLAGHAGNDLIDGEAGNDVLQDGEGFDVLRGASGDDTIIAAMDETDDDFDGGGGNDTISYAEATEDLTINLVQGVAAGVEIGEDSISGFENVVGGQADDVFVAGADPLRLTGNGGNDEFVFGNSGEPHPVVLHEIVDFKPGDLIKMSKWDIFEEVMDRAEDELSEIYGETIDEDGASIRYRRDQDNFETTILEADLNADNEYEITIALHGNHAFIIVEHT
jgi:Ca2+-binding RTX toxin-like protein